MRQRLRKPIVVVIVGIALIIPAMAGQVSPDKPGITVTLLGSGGGPNPNPKRFGPSILVQAGRQTLLFDCGRGATIRLAQIGKVLGEVRNVFLTHLHSDHIIGLPDLFLTGWGAQGRKTPLRVWGPAGTAQMMDHMQKAFEFDIRIRRDVDEKFVKEGIMVSSTDIKEGVVFEEDGVTVTAFLVDHRPVDIPDWKYCDWVLGTISATDSYARRGCIAGETTTAVLVMPSGRVMRLSMSAS